MQFQDVLNAYLEAKQAQRPSPHTLADYQNTYKKFLRFLGETVDGEKTDITQITARTISRFLASMDTVSKKTLLNYHTGLPSLWNWAIHRLHCRAGRDGKIGEQKRQMCLGENLQWHSPAKTKKSRLSEGGTQTAQIHYMRTMGVCKVRF